MFDNLSGRLSQVVRQLRGQARITEENIESSLREVRMALLEADVALPVVREFIEHVKQTALGQDVNLSLTPGQAIIKIVHDELVRLMGQDKATLNLNQQPPVVILMAGLQGAGKTTTVAKLGRWLQVNSKKSIMTVSCDIYRPAAIKQLEVLSEENKLIFYPSDVTQKPVQIAEQALAEAKRKFMDVLIVDTAGRLHIDADMMQEISQVHDCLNPANTIFVVDSMMGQDAVNAAKAFNITLPLTGVILTKTDGDARGGAALSIRHVTGKPILFMGTGERSTELSEFYPDRVASRILGMGDMLSLIEEVQQKTDTEKSIKLEKKLKKGKGFDMEDLRDQLLQMKNMGGISGLMDKLPGMGSIPTGVTDQVNNKQIERMEAIINSMTPKERKSPDIVNGSRKKRIASGSGNQIQDVNRLLKQHKTMQKMMKKMSKKGGMANMMRGLSGNLPPGFR
ncbi:MAG: signal recognition particle subunit SRP54 [Gammaproteobacteria bacterium]|jgi:signal recognition particle subunit SRP54